MEDIITTHFALCDDFLRAFGHCDDPQCRLSTAEVMTVALTAASFFLAAPPLYWADAATILEEELSSGALMSE